MACWLLFEPDGAGRGRFKAVPDDVVHDPDFRLSEAQWEQLQIPVGIVFVFHQTDQGGPVAFYPGPAGATESLLPLDTWAELQAANPSLAAMLPDVQALLVHRPKGGGQRCFIVPIDACYGLVGIIRRTWKGFDGGEEAWTRDRRLLRRPRGAQPAAARGDTGMSDLRFEIRRWTGRAVRGRADAGVQTPDRGARRSAGPVGRPAHPGAGRGHAPPLQPR